MELADSLRRFRKSFNLTQKQVADILNVAQKTYSDYELGKTRIPLDSMILLAKLYDVSMDYICGGSNVRNSFPRI